MGYVDVYFFGKKYLTLSSFKALYCILNFYLLLKKINIYKKQF